MKKVLIAITTGFIWLLKPLKLFAYSTRFGFLKRLIIQFTTFLDFIFSFIHGQNEVMEVYQKIYKGNFIFGHGIMKTDFESTLHEIQQPSMRTNHFMGIPVVSGNEVFIVNSPLISLGEPYRRLAREHIDETIFTADFYDLTYDKIKETCAVPLQEWLEDKDPKNITTMRSVSTRMVILLCQGIPISKLDSEQVTAAYLKRFVQLSLFKNYFTLITGLLGTEKFIKKDAFYPLKKLGVSSTVIDATLFAAMFSIGTLFTRCIGDLKKHKIDYDSLTLEEKKKFIIEVVRLYPTVTTTHRIIESPEEVVVAGRTIELTEGDEIVYPFVCSNKDEKVFKCPHAIQLDRSEEDYDKVLSWSKGAHACPARDFSILVTLVMLDTLNQKVPLKTIDYKGAIL
ncbi:cytochrome P450 [Aureispira anguillae]|uniref:Cytochrome P450 n=1 Tax=Aureispira anguillae TaxID=2864201 RepID=A0A916DWZ3_9BACT|nr:cytochrome P450 [Aureispira anguillae]BDS15342.1 cytochrome P450 [Aureispira anguillae]